MNILTHSTKSTGNTKQLLDGSRETQAWRIVLLMLLALYCFAFTAINFRALTEYMDNDIYADTLVAKYMWDQKSLFPEGWVFGNQYYVIATPVLSALFYGLTGSMNTAMACATTAMTIAILVALYWLLRPFGDKIFAVAGLTALVSSIITVDLGAREEAQLLFVLASYYGCYVLSLLVVWGDYVHSIFFEKKRINFPLLCGLLFSFATGMQSIRQTCVMIAPLLVFECLRVLTVLYTHKKVDWRITARVAAVTAANLVGVFFIRLLHIPAVQIYGDLSFVHLGELPERLIQIVKAGTKITGLWYVKYYAAQDGLLALFILIFSLLSIAAVLTACWRTAMRLYRKNVGGMEVLICLCVLSIAAVCASMLLFEISVRSIYLFVWYLLVTFSVVSLLPAENLIRKRLVLILLCALSTVNFYFSYKDSLQCAFNPDFKKNPPYYVDIANELESREIEILYGPAVITCDICGLTDGKVISSPWWRTPFEALQYIAPQDLHDPEDNERAAYLLTDAQLEDARRLASEKGAELTLIEKFDTMGLYSSSVQLMH